MAESIQISNVEIDLETGEVVFSHGIYKKSFPPSDVGIKGQSTSHFFVTASYHAYTAELYDVQATDQNRKVLQELNAG